MSPEPVEVMVMLFVKVIASLNVCAPLVLISVALNLTEPAASVVNCAMFTFLSNRVTPAEFTLSVLLPSTVFMKLTLPFSEAPVDVSVVLLNKVNGSLKICVPLVLTVSALIFTKPAESVVSFPMSTFLSNSVVPAEFTLSD
jgi:hypothetical protein